MFSIIKEHSCGVFILPETITYITLQLTEGIHNGFVCPKSGLLRVEGIIILPEQYKPLVY